MTVVINDDSGIGIFILFILAVNVWIIFRLAELQEKLRKRRKKKRI